MGDNANPEVEHRDISFRIIGVNGNGASVMSPVIRVVGEETRVRFARVAGCYFQYSTPQGQDPLRYTFVEVTFVYQQWLNYYYKWVVRVVRLGLDPQYFDSDIANVDPENLAVWDDWDTFPPTMVEDPGDLMPDVAYYPANYGAVAALSLVVSFVRYESSVDAHIYTCNGMRTWAPPWVVSWQNPVRVQTLVTGANGFHPRIDIGYFGRHGGPASWNVAIAFTHATYMLADSFHPYLIWGSVNNWPTTVNQDAIIYNGGGGSGGLPTIDIGPPDANNMAIAWTQARGGGFNNVTAVVQDSRGAQFEITPQETQNPENSVLRASASPSVAVWDDNFYDSIYKVTVSYLYSRNPNSWPWNPEARILTDDYYSLLPHGSQSDDNELSSYFHGKFDSGSQISNWYGMSCATCADSNGTYWSLWSSYYEDLGQSNLSQVHGIYGFAE